MANVTESAPSRLSYVGARPYIRGADVFRGFEDFALAGLAPAEQPVRLRSLKLHREVERDGHWRLDIDPSRASATLDFVIASGVARTAGFIEDGARITQRAPDLVSRVLELAPSGDFAGSARLAPAASTADWLDALIEANKAFHVRTLTQRGAPTDRIRFVYVEELPWIGASGTGMESVVVRHLGARNTDGRLYTLNAVTRASGATLKLCYSC